MSVEDRKEACKTYIEQTKLLVTLSSAFLFAPAGLVAILKDRSTAKLSGSDIWALLAIECMFIFSILAGYVAVASIAGSQDEGKYDVYRKATRFSSLLQIFFYVAGLILFVHLSHQLLFP